MMMMPMPEPPWERRAPLPSRCTGKVALLRVVVKDLLQEDEDGEGTVRRNLLPGSGNGGDSIDFVTDSCASILGSGEGGGRHRRRSGGGPFAVTWHRRVSSNLGEFRVGGSRRAGGDDDEEEDLYCLEDVEAAVHGGAASSTSSSSSSSPSLGTALRVLLPPALLLAAQRSDAPLSRGQSGGRSR